MYVRVGSSAKAAERDLTDWQKSSRITDERATASCNSKMRVSHMPSSFASSCLSPPFSVISFRHFALIYVCVCVRFSFSLASYGSLWFLFLSRKLFFFIFSLSLYFPLSTSLRTNRTIQSVVDCKNKRISLFLSCDVSASISEEGRVNAPLQRVCAALFYFRTHENRSLCFWPLPGDDSRPIRRAFVFTYRPLPRVRSYIRSIRNSISWKREFLEFVYSVRYLVYL